MTTPSTLKPLFAMASASRAALLLWGAHVSGAGCDRASEGTYREVGP